MIFPTQPKIIKANDEVILQCLSSQVEKAHVNNETWVSHSGSSDVTFPTVRHKGGKIVGLHTSSWGYYFGKQKLPMCGVYDDLGQAIISVRLVGDLVSVQMLDSCYPSIELHRISEFEVSSIHKSIKNILSNLFVYDIQLNSMQGLQ